MRVVSVDTVCAVATRRQRSDQVARRRTEEADVVSGDECARDASIAHAHQTRVEFQKVLWQGQAEYCRRDVGRDVRAYEKTCDSRHREKERERESGEIRFFSAKSDLIFVL
jgi:hypothetical protein